MLRTWRCGGRRGLVFQGRVRDLRAWLRAAAGLGPVAACMGALTGN